MKRLDRIQEIFNNASERQKRKKIDRMSWLEQLATKMRVLEMHRPIVLYLVICIWLDRLTETRIIDILYLYIQLILFLEYWLYSY